jgi:hypothetical protein
MEINTSSIETYWGEVYTACLHVHSESMPAARIEVNPGYVPKLVKLVESFGLKHREKEYGEKTYIWIYKYHHLQDVIDKVKEAPIDIFHIWLSGKLLGMTEKAIESYILSIGE